jgi:hypothetical protein
VAGTDDADNVEVTLFSLPGQGLTSAGRQIQRVKCVDEFPVKFILRKLFL